MKRLISLVMSLVVAAGPFTAQAAEPVVCSITTSGTSANTSSCTSGSATWEMGATVLVACDQSVYIDSTNPTPRNPAGTPTASSADQLIDFASNKDPYIVYLNPGDKHIAVIQVTTAGTCKFMTTLRPKPWQHK